MRNRRSLFRKVAAKVLAGALAGVLALSIFSSGTNLSAVEAEEAEEEASFVLDGNTDDWKDIVDILEEPEGVFDRVAAYCDEETFNIMFAVNDLSKWCYFQIYLDIDNDPSTGYDTDGGGYEFLVENGFLYVSYAGEWPGTEVDYIDFGQSEDGSVIEVAVPYELISPKTEEIGFHIVLLNDSWESIYKYTEEDEVIAQPKEKVTIVSDEPYISDFELNQEETLALTEASMQDGVIATFSAKGGDSRDYKYTFVTSEKNGPDNKAFKLDGNKLITNKKLLAPGEYTVNVKVKSGVRSEIKSFKVEVKDPAPGSITDDIFTGDMGEWFVVDNAEAKDASENYTLVAASSQDKLFAMVSSLNKDLNTRTSFVLDTDNKKGFKYLGLEGADFVVRQQKLYPVIADNKLGAAIITVDEDYYPDYATVSVYLEDIGNPKNVGVHAFALNRAVSIPETGYLTTKDAFEMTYEEGFAYPKAGFDAFANPGTGWACWTTIGEEGAKKIAFDYDLAYLPLTWSNLELSKGTFDWENVEKEYHISFWEENDVNFIIRFVIDTPEPLTGSRKDETYGEFVDKAFIEKNNLLDDGKVTEDTVKKLVATGNYRMDIPAWLFAELCNDVVSEKIENAGTFYNWPDFDVLGGAGFSPNYYSESFIKYHAACIKAIAGEFDGSAAYIEMGSLGHWGEMHTWPTEESFEEYDFGSGEWPDDETVAKYAKAYTDNFKKTKVGIRSSYDFSIENKFGMFNDVFGQEEGTEDFLVDCSKAPDFWKSNYSGGEFASGDVLAWTHNDTIMRSISYLRDSHTSWLGPCSPCDIEKGSKEASSYRGNIEYLQKLMGYRLRVSKVNAYDTAKAGSRLNLDLTFVNDGIAPSYNDYQVEVFVLPENAESIEDNLGTATADFAASKIMPGDKANVKVPVTIGAKAEGKVKVAVAVIDKGTKKPVMNLGMANKIFDKVYELYTIEIE